MSKSHPSAAVIGAGFGGLAAAIRLQAAGFQTTLFEKRDKIGGRAYVFHDKGFTFDAGPTVITAPECLEELFHLGGKQMKDYVELVPVNPFYRLLWDDGRKFEYSNDEEALFDQIRSFNPEDVDGYKRFFEYSTKVFEAGYTNLVSEPFLSFKDMIRAAPQLVKLQAYRSVYSMVSKFVKDEHLREAFSFHSLLIGGNPFRASSIYTLIHALERKWGVHFPKGGTHALIRALGKLFTDLGGEIRTNAEIQDIIVSGAKVDALRLQGGTEIPFDLIVSNADVLHTYRNLLANVPQVERTRRKLEKSDYSMSLFLIYFGTRKKYPNVAHHSVIFGPRYRGLLDDIFNKGVLADDFSLYLHCPTQTDSSLAPEGCEGFYVLSPVPHLGKSAVDWNLEGPRYANRILTYLDRKFLPGLKENLETVRLFTPEDFKLELNAHLGNAFSLEPTLQQSAYFRVHNRDPHVQNLYFVGAGTHPGAGVPGVINSAKATAKVILQEWSAKLSAVTRLELSHV